MYLGVLVPEVYLEVLVPEVGRQNLNGIKILCFKVSILQSEFVFEKPHQLGNLKHV